jgi:hypothetical protein
MPDLAPVHLSASSRRIWADLTASFQFERHELEVLRLALEALDRAAQARRAIRRDGLFHINRFGDPIAHPAAKVEKDSAAAAARLLQQLAIPADTAERSVTVTRG